MRDLSYIGDIFVGLCGSEQILMGEEQLVYGSHS